MAAIEIEDVNKDGKPDAVIKDDQGQTVAIVYSFKDTIIRAVSTFAAIFLAITCSGVV